MSKRNCKNQTNCKDCKKYCVPAEVLFKKKTKLKEIYFLYNGYSISVTKNVDDFDTFLFDYYYKYKSEHEKSIDDYFKQLDVICSAYDCNVFDNTLDTTFVMNVFVLTKMNVIINDDNNGLLYIYN